ncbi:MAG: hypothetical protein COB53_06370 [Elusimicrobia bacterium]|nr:MAG: hypothetical protein COB53_06370 [Elusimicrobiota bacterium]
MSDSEYNRTTGTDSIIWHGAYRARAPRLETRMGSSALPDKGLNFHKTAAIWGQSPRAVEYWMKRFSKEELPNAKPRRGPGRPPVLSDQQMEYLVADLSKGPQSVGFHAHHWTGPLLKRYLGEYYGAHMTVRHCQRLIRQAEGEGDVVSYMRN